MVPDELAAKLDELDLLAVQLSDDRRAPVLRDQREFFGEIYLVHGSLTHQRKESPKPFVTQKETAPEEHPEDDREHDRKGRRGDANVRRDGATEITGQQDRAEHRRPWDQIEDGA